jgi:hypothetical protein
MTNFDFHDQLFPTGLKGFAIIFNNILKDFTHAKSKKD